MNNTFKVGFITDPLNSLNPKKDSTLAMVQACLKRQWQTFLIDMRAISALSTQISSSAYQVDELNFSTLPESASGSPNAASTKSTTKLPPWLNASVETIDLSSLDLIVMRKDPPYTPAYHFCTQILTLLEQQGVTVSNSPRSLREFNEKLFILHFPQFISPTLVTSELAQASAFCQQHGEVVIKPLDAMGGSGIFKIRSPKDNLAVIVELLSHTTQQPIMLQKFVPQISDGDKRVLIINGEPVPHLLARVPQGDDFRGNLAVGGKGIVQELSNSDRAIAEAIGPTLKEHGIHFAGLDIIGDRLTEINITSPTCIREIEQETGLDVSGSLMDTLSQIARPT